MRPSSSLEFYDTNNKINNTNYSLLQQSNNNMLVTPYVKEDQINTTMNSPTSSSSNDEDFNNTSLLNRKNGSKRRSQVKNACVNCQKACKKCDEGRPCQRCIKLGITDTCIDSPRKERKKGFKRGPYRKKSITTQQHIIPKRVVDNTSNNPLFTTSIAMKREQDVHIYSTSSAINNWSNLTSPIYNEPTMGVVTTQYNQQQQPNSFSGVQYNSYSSSNTMYDFDPISVMVQPQPQQNSQFMTNYTTTTSPISPTHSNYNNNVLTTNNMPPYYQQDEFGLNNPDIYDDNYIQNNSTITSSPENLLSTNQWSYTDPTFEYNNAQFVSKLGDHINKQYYPQQQETTIHHRHSTGQDWMAAPDVYYYPPTY